uniref:Uncharacterized protein n=1 Tax=Timema poppense TaxID=170557 RepID=A0A7R9DA15_TIMPO|nr:unnamed protein product [Timema poppensis]
MMLSTVKYGSVRHLIPKCVQRQYPVKSDINQSYIIIYAHIQARKRGKRGSENRGEHTTKKRGKGTIFKTGLYSPRPKLKSGRNEPGRNCMCEAYELKLFQWGTRMTLTTVPELRLTCPSAGKMESFT